MAKYNCCNMFEIQQSCVMLSFGFVWITLINSSSVKNTVIQETFSAAFNYIRLRSVSSLLFRVPARKGCRQSSVE